MPKAICRREHHLSVVDVVPPFVGSGSATQWHNGWTVGAGWEYGLTQNWIVGLEYDYSAFEAKRYQLAGAAAGVYTFDAKPAIFSRPLSASTTSSVARVRSVLMGTKPQDKSPGRGRGFYLGNRRLAYPITENPPSTGIAVPVTKSEALDERNTATPRSRRSRPIVPPACAPNLVVQAVDFWRARLVRSVSIQPGSTALAWMLSQPRRPRRNA